MQLRRDTQSYSMMLTHTYFMYTPTYSWIAKCWVLIPYHLLLGIIERTQSNSIVGTPLLEHLILRVRARSAAVRFVSFRFVRFAWILFRSVKTRARQHCRGVTRSRLKILTSSDCTVLKAFLHFPIWGHWRLLHNCILMAIDDYSIGWLIESQNWKFTSQTTTTAWIHLKIFFLYARTSERRPL